MQAIEQVLTTLIRPCAHHLTQHRGIGTTSIAIKDVGKTPQLEPTVNNRIAQDHRSIKQRYYPMRGFGSFAPASRFCSPTTTCAAKFATENT